ncbi:MAG: hypothetical protein K2M53_00635, partial [Muribaculaceae bacterium]|nr:hypothetical protein [Muribaculaceae bacterium]
YIDRFRDIKNIYVGETSQLKTIGYFFDYLKTFLIDGASFNDYFGYKFYNLNNKGRQEYITFRRTRRLQRLCNSNENIDNFRNKIKFNTLFNDYLGRKWLDVSSSSFDDFQLFLSSIGKSVFVKDVNGLCGRGVERYEIKDINPKDLYKTLGSAVGSRFLLEEPITQTGVLADLHPWSVNTIRITTVLSNDGQDLNIMGAVLRMGTGKDHRDNLHAGGIAAQIDIETGIIMRPGFDKANNAYMVHPDTKKKIVGLSIPDWSKCKEYIKEVAKVDSKVRYVGWDVVIKGDGSFILIEGNDNGDHDVQQLHYKGLWNEYKKVLGIKE